MTELLRQEELPDWFSYPAIFLSVLNQGLTDFHPWHILRGDHALWRLRGVQKRFPDKDIVPFAERTDCDDIACFDRASPGAVVVLHDFAGQRWAHPRTFASFGQWVHAAIDDMLSFEAEGSIWSPDANARKKPK